MLPGMWPTVRSNARAFQIRFECEVDEMYVDVEDLVTCADGNLIDPLPAALALQWTRRADGQPASTAEVAAEWHFVKDHRLGWWPHRQPRPIYLTPEALERLFFQKFDQNEIYLARRWTVWDRAPADAQMGAHSCAWAAGAGWHAPDFDAAFERFDFRKLSGMPGTDGNDPALRGFAWLRDTKPADDAAGNHRPTANPGLRPRNLANQQLFWNAGTVLADGRDPSVLYWPTPLDG